MSTSIDEKKAKDKIRHKKYYSEHKEELIEKQKQYRSKNKGTIAEKKKQYEAEHRDGHNERQKRYRKNNKEKIKESNRKSIEKKKEENILGVLCVFLTGRAFLAGARVFGGNIDLSLFQNHAPVSIEKAR